MRVHQLLPTFTPGDAMGQAAVAWQRVFRHLGASGQIFAGEVAEPWHSLVRPLSELRVAADDLVLYHHGIASSLAGKLLHLPCRKAVAFHNVTPARFYAGTQLAEPLIAGRAQLAAMADFVEFSIGVSEFNARELREAGHRSVLVAPLFVEPERFTIDCADQRLTSKLASAGRPRVVSVSRVVPHKRMEDLLSLHEELRRIAPLAELWIVGGYAAGNIAFKKLRSRAE
ncbi:MAG: glycosyl transferase family 1, partial [Archangium sp.]|nr:glycosyl transferase family 1 [Archangium sp.]